VHALVLGLTLGLGAGLAPGPLMAVVIRATLEGGFAAGARVACGPLVTDLPIVVFAVLLAAELPDAALGALGIAGGLFVLYLGVEALRDLPAPLEAAAGAPAPAAGALRRGALVNLLSPHPWVFWITVGAPILGDAGPAGAIAFLVPFYLLLIGAKVVLAAGLGAGRERLVRGRGYTLALRAAGALMLVAGVLLIVEGIRTV
jgi:threonine/homoserine/homoserine lactone efflux protein